MSSIGCFTRNSRNWGLVQKEKGTGCFFVHLETTGEKPHDVMGDLRSPQRHGE